MLILLPPYLRRWTALNDEELPQVLVGEEDSWQSPVVSGSWVGRPTIISFDDGGLPVITFDDENSWQALPMPSSWTRSLMLSTASDSEDIMVTSPAAAEVRTNPLFLVDVANFMNP